MADGKMYSNHYINILNEMNENELLRNCMKIIHRFLVQDETIIQY